MTILQTSYVLEVAYCGSISQAAERLFLSQSALSQQILKLENELNYSLFTRTLYGLKLTPAGERFCEEARPVVEAWNQLCRTVQCNGYYIQKQLRIGMGSRVYSNGLFPHIVSFFDERPEIEVSFFTEAGSDILTLLRQKSIDIALDVLPSETSHLPKGEFYTCPLISEPQCVLMATDNPLAGKPKLSLQDLQGTVMMSGLEHSTEARNLKELCRRHGISFQRVYRSDGITTLMSLVRTGRGIVLGPRSFAAYYQVAAVPLYPETQASLQFICLEKVTRTKIIRDFRNYLVAICAG